MSHPKNKKRSVALNGDFPWCFWCDGNISCVLAAPSARYGQYVTAIGFRSSIVQGDTEWETRALLDV
jgi:hypothetical protein